MRVDNRYRTACEHTSECTNRPIETVRGTRTQNLNGEAFACHDINQPARRKRYEYGVDAAARTLFAHQQRNDALLAPQMVVSAHRIKEMRHAQRARCVHSSKYMLGNVSATRPVGSK